MPTQPFPDLTPASLRTLISRTGCTTCKSRKVKCDENKPKCLRCTKAGRKCRYGVVDSRPHMLWSSVALLDRPPLSDLDNRGQQERLAFEYYFQLVAPALAGAVDPRFWRGVALQTCRSEPAIWDAIIAISALYKDPDPNLCMEPVQSTFGAVPSRKHHQALAWYCRSLEQTRIMISRGSMDSNLALISCLLYICIETLQGRVGEALGLYNQAVRLILTVRGSLPKSSYGAMLLQDIMIPMFYRLGAVALMISTFPILDPFDLVLPTTNYYFFTTIEAARTGLMSLVAELLLFTRAARNYLDGADSDSKPSTKLRRSQHLFMSRLDQWSCAFTDFQRKIQVSDDDATVQSEVAALLTFHAAMFIIASTSLTQRESVFDDHIPLFRLIVDQARKALQGSERPDGSQPPFTFELGVGLSLQFTANRCRHPLLRQEALELLRQATPVQGIYKCALWATLSAKVIELENGSSQGLRQRKSVKGTIEQELPFPAEQQYPRNNDGELGDRGASNDSVVRREDVPSLNELVPVNDEEHNASFVIGEQDLLPEERRVHEFGVFRLKDTGRIDYDGAAESGGEMTMNMAWRSEKRKDQLFLRFTRNRRDQGGEYKLVEYFVPFEY